MGQSALVWQGLLFSGAALLLVSGSAWWLYLSPVRGMSVARVATPSVRLATWVAVLLGLAALQMMVGAFWDTSQHLRLGVVVGGRDFLWPSHIVIYSSFLLSYTVGLGGLLTLAVAGRRAGVYDPRLWVRRNPYLGVVVLVSAYEIMAIPGDALWHLLFGKDLTAWSPPHLFLALAACGVTISAVALLLRAWPATARPAQANLLGLGLIGMTLNIAYFIGVLEWELPVHELSREVAARPHWAYLVVAGAVALFLLDLSRRLLPYRWAATGVAAVFYLIRLAVTAGLSVTGNLMPQLPLVFLLGAVLLDAVANLRPRPGFGRDALLTVAFLAGYALLSLPVVFERLRAVHFSAADAAASLGILFVLGLGLLPLARLVGGGLVGGNGTILPDA